MAAQARCPQGTYYNPSVSPLFWENCPQENLVTNFSECKMLGKTIVPPPSVSNWFTTWQWRTKNGSVIKKIHQRFDVAK